MKKIISDKPFLIVLLSAIIIRVSFAVIIPAWQSPDEYPHYWVAKEFVETGKYPVSEIEFPKYEAFQPPLYYLILSIPIIFQNSYLNYSEIIEYPSLNLIILRLISVLASSLSLIFAYLFFMNKFSGDKAVSIYSTSFILLLPTYTGLSATLNNDALVILFSFACLYFLSKNKIKIRDVFLSGLFGGLAVFTKLNALPVFLLGGYLIVKNQYYEVHNNIKYIVVFSAGWLVFSLALFYRDIIFYQDFLIVAPGKVKADSFSFSYLVWAVRNLTWSFLAAFGRSYNITPSVWIYVICFLPIIILAVWGWVKGKLELVEKNIFPEIIAAGILAAGASLYYTLSYMEGTMTSWGKNIYPILPYIAAFFVVGLRRISNNYFIPALSLVILFLWDVWYVIKFIDM